MAFAIGKSSRTDVSSALSFNFARAAVACTSAAPPSSSLARSSFPPTWAS